MQRRFGSGVLDTLPFSLTVGALGVIFGASAGPAGIPGPAAILMSMLVFSGSAQFASLELWHQGAWVVALTTLLLSARFLLMGASLGARLPRTRPWQRWLLAFSVTDESYALAVSRGAGQSAVSLPYLAGSVCALYLPWVAGTAVGVQAGHLIPAGWSGGLLLVFPLVFLTLTVLTADSRPKAAVALLGGVLSVIGAIWLPAGWNVLLAGLAASGAGPLLERAVGREVQQA